MDGEALISKNLEAVIKAISVAINKQAEVQTKGSSAEKLAPFVVRMVGSAIDLLISAAKGTGIASAAGASVLIINRVAGFAALSDNDKIVCLGAMAELATAISTDGVEFAASTTSEMATGGMSTPVSVPLMIASGASLAMAAINVSQQCGPLVIRGIPKLHDEAFRVYIEANQRIGYPMP